MADELRRDAADAARGYDRTDMDRTDDREMNRHMPDPPGQARIVPLDDVKGEFKVAEDEPDIRGWEVRTSDGTEVGKVSDLIVDTGQMKVRYIEVKLDGDVIGSDDDRVVLLPIGEARLDDDEDDVYVNLDIASLTALPAYDRSNFDRSYETNLRDRFRGDTSVSGTASTASGTAGGMGEAVSDLAAANRVPDADEDFYQGSSYDEGRLFGKRREGRENESYLRLNEERLDIDKRQVERGEARVRKTVDTQHVRQSVPVEHEEVTVERRPLSADARIDDAEISEDEIRVPLRGEELVVDKRVVPTEEVVIRKKVVRDDEVVEADLARERLEVQDDATRRRPDDRRSDDRP